jgi:hypothetical protein
VFRVLLDLNLIEADDLCDAGLVEGGQRVKALSDAALAPCSKSSAVVTVFSPWRTVSTRDDTE